jgi:ABC-2 type transport system ATP-binding protein
VNLSSKSITSQHYRDATSVGIVLGMDTTPNPHIHRPATPSGRSPLATAPSPAHGNPPDERPVALSASALRCRYGAFEAVRSIDLTIHQGETFALLGTNGAGKTTTLETLEGHRAPDRGHVEVLGLDPHRDRRSLAGRIGVMFQASGLPGELTPPELLEVWARLTPDAWRHLDVADALARVELDHRADVRIRQLSGGERRRLDLALALLNDPELVFLDEPTTGMDPQARERTWQILRDLRADGVTILFTTHYLEEAEALADRLAIMHTGRLATTGTLAEVIASHPATITARLPGITPKLPSLDGDLDVATNRELTITTRRLQQDLTDLLLWARTHGLDLLGLQANDASLTQVFHDIAGAPMAGEPDAGGQEGTR